MRGVLLDAWGRWALPVSLVGVVVCAAITASPYLPGGPLEAPWLGLPLGVVVLLLVWGTVQTLGGMGGAHGRALLRVLRRFPPTVVVLMGVGLVGFWLVLVVVARGPDGHTERIDGRYYARDGDEVTEIDENEYDARRIGDTRIFAAFAGGMFAVTAGVAVRARSESERGDQAGLADAR